MCENAKILCPYCLTREIDRHRRYALLVIQKRINGSEAVGMTYASARMPMKSRCLP